MNGRVLVTGSEGFTGQHVCEAFENAGWEVWGAGTKPLERKRYLRIDLLKPETLGQISSEVNPDLVIHLAGVAFVAKDDADIYYKVNLIGTKNLLEALCLKNGSKETRVILASSSNVYGEAGEVKIAEDTPLSPVSDYAVSKVAVEFLGKSYRDRLGITIVRPFNYTGVGQDQSFLIPKIVRHFRDRASTIELGNLDVARDFSDVRDIARYYLAVAEAEVSNDTINFCSGRASSLREIIEICEAATAHYPGVVVNPAYVRKNEIRVLVGNNSKLFEATGAQKITDIEETIRWMLAHTRA